MHFSQYTGLDDPGFDAIAICLLIACEYENFLLFPQFKYVCHTIGLLKQPCLKHSPSTVH